MRAARANRIVENPAEPDGTAKARQVYEDLLVDLPRSPYLLHNLGLALYREDRPEDAAVRFHLAREELANLDMNLTQRRNLAYKFHYHLGGVLFTAAETSNDEEAVTGYQKALEEFKQAVKMDPADSDAKYNYELTLLLSLVVPLSPGFFHFSLVPGEEGSIHSYIWRRNRPGPS